MARKQLYIRTLGCPKNEADSEHLRGMLEAGGYASTGTADSADVVLVNTCSFIEQARQESVDAILEEVAHRRDGQAVVVSGCLVERYGPELEKELPEVDAFLSLGSYGRAVEAVDKAVAGARQVCFDAGKVPLDLPLRGTPTGPTSFVKISEGCDRICSFCAIPGIRGRHRSRPPAAIGTELTWLAKRGVKEAVLVGQDMSLYGRDTTRKWMLPDLIRRLARIETPPWIRTLYHYPRFVNDDLLEAIASNQAAVHYLDLSLQHASGKLVRKMRRWGDGDRFLTMIDRIRTVLPDAALRSAFIIGFPGETQKDVEELAAFLRAARIDWAGFFPWSKEEGTEAAGFKRGLVARAEIEARVEALQRVQNEVAEAKRAELVGQRIEVLVESSTKTTATGRTFREAPDVDGTVTVRGVRDAVPGDLLAATVAKLDGLDLVASRS